MTASLGSSTSAPATRGTAPGWRDARLWIGVAIVAGSVLLGARVLDQADRTVPVWAARAELPVGEVLEPDDLVARRVRFADRADEERYLRADRALPGERALVRAVAAGELVPAGALGDATATGLLTVPLSVPLLAVPPQVAPGSVVDVWVTTDTGSGGPVAKPVLEQVVVIDAPPVADSFGVSGERQLVLGVDETQGEALGAVLAAVGESAITVVARG